MKLSELLNRVKVVQVTGNAELTSVENITIDSRAVTKGSIFFAIKGDKTDGHKFIPEVINQGAAAVVLQDVNSVPDQIFSHSGCIKIVVEDSRKSLAEFSNIFFGCPSQKLTLIAITGTKGKTTTLELLNAILEAAGSLDHDVVPLSSQDPADDKETTRKRRRIKTLEEKIAALETDYPLRPLSATASVPVNRRALFWSVPTEL